MSFPLITSRGDPCRFNIWLAGLGRDGFGMTGSVAAACSITTDSASLAAISAYRSCFVAFDASCSASQTTNINDGSQESNRNELTKLTIL